MLNYSPKVLVLVAGLKCSKYQVCDKSMVDSKVIDMRKTSMVDGNSNTNKEPDSTR